MKWINKWKKKNETYIHKHKKCSYKDNSEQVVKKTKQKKNWQTFCVNIYHGINTHTHTVTESNE